MDEGKKYEQIELKCWKQCDQEEVLFHCAKTLLKWKQIILNSMSTQGLHLL